MTAWSASHIRRRGRHIEGPLDITILVVAVKAKADICGEQKRNDIAFAFLMGLALLRFVFPMCSFDAFG